MFDTEAFLKNYQIFWQYPVKTEEEFYKQNKHNPNYIGLPWATIIDKGVNQKVLVKALLPLIKTKNTYTCCQHIHFRNLIPIMKIIGIKAVYTPHKVIGQDEINGFYIYPCPLYAVNVEDNTRNNEFQNVDYNTIERKYLYSFMGGYQSNYLTKIRKNIFEIKHHDDAFILNTGSWHFNNVVYSNKQNIKKELNIDNNHIEKTKNYNKLLLQSRFSLCPSGSGPNSIRFWESLAVGAIPILLADTLELPEHSLWENAIIKLEESKLETLTELLSKISEEKEKEMRENCIQLYNYYKNNYRNLLTNDNKKTIFTSYKCSSNEPIIQNILTHWKLLNPSLNILYFSDADVDTFFKETEYYNTYKKMKNGVAIADFFRICYINKYGGYWFDLDITPVKLNLPKEGKIHLFDVGYNNISYMFIGGSPNQKLFNEVINKVIINIENNSVKKHQHIMDITGPRVIQNIICNKLNIVNKDGCLVGVNTPKKYLVNTDYEFIYSKIKLQETKTNEYKLLQKQNNKMPYQHYNYI